MRFTANCVTYQTQDGVAMLGFADDEFKTNQYVLLQKGLAPPSPQDRQGGVGRPHIEVNSQSPSGYGGVARAQLLENRLVITLHPQAAAEMTVDDSIDIAFHVSKQRLREMGNQLCLVLGKDIVEVDSGV